MKIVLLILAATVLLTACVRYTGNPHGCPPGLKKQGRCWD